MRCAADPPPISDGSYAQAWATHPMSEARRVDPLEGITLKAMVEHLAERYGWEGLGARIHIRCFTHDPSVLSSLKFLRKTP